MESNTNISSLFRAKLTTKLISLFLTLLIIFFSIPSIVYAETAEALSGLGSDETGSASDSESDSSATLKSGEVYEETELREENVKHFRLEDGSSVAAVYPSAVHLSDGNGGWIDIDNSLHSVSGDIGTSDGRIKLSKKITGNENLFTLHSGNKKITFSLIGAKKGVIGEAFNNEDAESDTLLQKMMNLEKLSSSVIYRDILSGVDLEYELNGAGVKENIIIKERASSYTYSFELKLNGLSAVLEKDGSVSLLDESGDISYVIPAPVIFDANGSLGSAAYTLTENGGNGKYTLTVTADSKWMNDSERAFPVTLDPAVCPSTSYYTDTYIISSQPSSAYSAAAFLNVTEYITSYIKASNLDFIPRNSYVSSATLALVTLGTYNTSVGAYLVTSNWDSTLTYAKTQLASSPQGTVGKIITYNQIKNTSSGTIVEFNVTEAFKYWQDNPTLNYGLALKRVGSTGSAAFASMECADVNVKPCFMVNYVNHNGIESYNSYSSHSVGGVATGNVNLATGALVMDIPLLTASNEVLPYIASLTYDGARAGTQFYSANANVPYGFVTSAFGFKWSMQQSVVKKSYVNANGETKSLYIWCDADGTEHSFFEGSTSGVYEDADGLGLKLRQTSSETKITSKDKTVYTFSAVEYPGEYTGAWHLVSIKDRNGNTLTFTSDSISRKPVNVKFTPASSSSSWEILRFAYNSSSVVPAAIYDPLTGRGVVFSYSDTVDGEISLTAKKYLRKIDYVTGSTTWTESDWVSPTSGEVISSLELTYSSSGHILQALETVSDVGISYTIVDSKVMAVQEKNSQGVGQEIGFIYGTGYTDIRSSGTNDVYGNSDDIITRNIFDSYGRAVSVYSKNAAGTRVYNGVLGEYEEQENIRNNIKEVVNISEGSVNYLMNGGFDEGADGFDYWVKSADVGTDSASDRPKSINKAKMSVSASGSSYIYQTVRLLPDTYTISLDLTSTNAIGVTVGVKITNLNNTSSVQTYEFAKNERLNDYSIDAAKIKRVSESFTVSSDSRYKIEIFAIGDSTASNAKIYVDNVMLSAGKEMAEYNLVDFAGFDRYSCDTSGNLLYFDSCWSGGQEVTTSSVSPLLSQSLRIYCADINSICTAKQIVYQSSEGIRSGIRKFVVSGYGRSEAAVLSNNAFFGIKVEVKYSGENKPDIFEYNFDPTFKDWQFTSGIFETRDYSVIESITVICEFSGQLGASAYFDNISIVDATDYNTLRYTYYENGNVKTVSDFDTIEYYRYDSNNNLIAKANNYRILYQYDYGLV